MNLGFSPQIYFRKRNLLGKSKVNDANVTHLINHDILWFHISVGNSVLMDMRERQRHASSVESHKG
jgi:hypothetical protein